jgi:methyl-accepting chemotaxis protein
VQTVESGQGLVRGTVNAMTEIAQGVGQVSAIILEISAASSQQNSDARVVRSAVEQLDEMTQQNAALVEQGAAAAMSLREEAGRLQELVHVFQLGEPTNEAAASTT